MEINKEFNKITKELLQIDTLKEVYERIAPLNKNFDVDNEPFDKASLIEQILNRYFHDEEYEELNNTMEKNEEERDKEIQELLDELMTIKNDDNTATEIRKRIDSTLNTFQMEIQKLILAKLKIAAQKLKINPNLLKITPKEGKKLLNFLQIPANNGTWDMIQNLTKTKNGRKDLTQTVISKETKRGNIKLKVDEESNKSLQELVKSLSPTVQQTFIYLLDQAKNDKMLRVKFSPKDFFEKKNTTYQKKTVQRLISDLDILTHTTFNFTCKVKGEEMSAIGQALMYTVYYTNDDVNKESNGMYVEGHRIKEISVTFGDWAESLVDNQFTLINCGILKYNTSRFPYSVPLALKFAERYRNNAKNRKKDSWEKLSIKNLIEYLEIPDSRFNKKGFRYIADTIEKTLDLIAHEENYEWQYAKGEHTNKKDFLNDVILYRSKDEELNLTYNGIKKR